MNLCVVICACGGHILYIGATGDVKIKTSCGGTLRQVKPRRVNDDTDSEMSELIVWDFSPWKWSGRLHSYDSYIINVTIGYSNLESPHPCFGYVTRH